MSGVFADKINARQRARDLLDECEIVKAPVPIERIIKKCSVALHYLPFEEDLSGMAYINEGVAIIGVNALHHANRQRFSAAHELGHHILHADLLKDAIHVDKGPLRVLLRGELASQGVDPREIEANAFAAEILMPQRLLAEALDTDEIDIEDDDQMDALAKKFRVSASAIRFRLSDLLAEYRTA